MKKLADKQVLEILEKAKKEFISDLLYDHSGIESGLCYYVGLFIKNKIVINWKDYIETPEEKESIILQVASWITLFIPEFNYDWLEGNTGLTNSWQYWWNPVDKKSRIKALDKLITHYESRIEADKGNQEHQNGL